MRFFHINSLKLLGIMADGENLSDGDGFAIDEDKFLIDEDFDDDGDRGDFFRPSHRETIGDGCFWVRAKRGAE